MSLGLSFNVLALFSGLFTNPAKKRIRHYTRLKYIPIVREICDKLGVTDRSYADWVYYASISGNYRLSFEREGSILDLIQFLKANKKVSRNKNIGICIGNILLLLEYISDLLNTYGQNISNYVTLHKFYKYKPGTSEYGHNPNYNKDLEHYIELEYLLCDLMLDLTRNLNYLLTYIRTFDPSFLEGSPTVYINGLDNFEMSFKDGDLPKYKTKQEFLIRRVQNPDDFYSHNPVASNYFL